MLIGADTSGFWATTAQVVPVLVLAMVIEARLVARRFAQPRNSESRNARSPLSLGLWLIATLVSQLGLFLYALLAVGGVDVRVGLVADDAAWTPDMLVAVGVLFNGLLLVAWVPVAPIGAGLVRMALPGVWFPGSHIARNRARARRLLASADEQLGLLKRDRHDGLMWLAGAVLVRAEAVRAHDREDHEIEMGRRGPLGAEERSEREMINERLGELDRRIDEARARIDRMTSVVKVSETTFPELKRLYAGRTPGPEVRLDEEKHMREFMAAAAGATRVRVDDTTSPLGHPVHA